jgi:hypothetical protein
MHQPLLHPSYPGSSVLIENLRVTFRHPDSFYRVDAGSDAKNVVVPTGIAPKPGLVKRSNPVSWKNNGLRKSFLVWPWLGTGFCPVRMLPESARVRHHGRDGCEQTGSGSGSGCRGGYYLGPHKPPIA